MSRPSADTFVPPTQPHLVVRTVSATRNQHGCLPLSVDHGRGQLFIAMLVLEDRPPIPWDSSSLPRSPLLRR